MEKLCLTGRLHKDVITCNYYGGLEYRCNSRCNNVDVVFSIDTADILNPDYEVNDVFFIEADNVYQAQLAQDALAKEHNLGLSVTLSDPDDVYDVAGEDYEGTWFFLVSELNGEFVCPEYGWVAMKYPSDFYGQYPYIGMGYMLACGELPCALIPDELYEVQGNTDYMASKDGLYFSKKLLGR